MEWVMSSHPGWYFQVSNVNVKHILLDFQAICHSLLNTAAFTRSSIAKGHAENFSLLCLWPWRTTSSSFSFKSAHIHNRPTADVSFNLQQKADKHLKWDDSFQESWKVGQIIWMPPHSTPSCGNHCSHFFYRLHALETVEIGVKEATLIFCDKLTRDKRESK